MVYLQHRAIVFAILALSAGCTRQTTRGLATPVSLPRELQAIPSDAARWERGPSPGAEVAILWGDPQHGAAGGERYRFQPGFASPEHTHPFHERAVVIRGTFVIIRLAQTYRLNAGGYFFIPAGSVHATRCESAEPCEVYNEVIPDRP